MSIESMGPVVNQELPNENIFNGEVAEKARQMSWPSRFALGTAAVARTFGNDVRTFWRAGIEDYHDASLAKKAVVGPMVGVSAMAMALDIPLHEWYLAKVVTHEYIASHGSTLHTGLAEGGASFGVEGLIATGMAAGIYNMPKFTDAVANRFMKKDRGENPDGVVGKASYALFYGAGPLTFKDSSERENRKLTAALVAGLSAAAFLGVVNVGIGSGVAWLLDYGARHPGTRERISMDTVNVLKNTGTWMAFIGGRIGIKKYISARKVTKSQTNSESIDESKETLRLETEGV